MDEEKTQKTNNNKKIVVKLGKIRKMTRKRKTM